MGCANSKRSRCRHCQTPYSPMPRSYSMHVHHPPEHRGDSYHVVALTSTTLGSLRLDDNSDQNNIVVDCYNGIDNDDKMECGDDENVCNGSVKINGFSMGVIEAKTWSNMINGKIQKVVPKTPIRTPPGEPETINAWELMEGLEDISPLRPLNHVRSFSFDVVRSPIPAPFDCPKSRLQENGTGSPQAMWPCLAKNDLDSKLEENGKGSPEEEDERVPLADDDLDSKLQENGTGSPKPIWLEMADDELNSKSIVSEFDPEVISTFRKSLQELPPDNPFYLRPQDDEKRLVVTVSINKQFEVTDVKKANGIVSDCKCPAYGRDKVIVYFTSLRGVRKTYEDCCYVRVILKGLGVRVDERDVSMHSGFKEELKELLGDGFCWGGLPRVFLGKKYIGGAEEIRRMHEEGQLEKVLEGCEMVDDGIGSGGVCGGVCEACGDIRFVPCETCSGSCKIYYEGDEDDEDECEEGENGFQRCPDCNENGLIRCPLCCY